MEAKDKEILFKILKHAQNVDSFCDDCFCEDDLINSEKTLSATAFELLQIGELAKMKLSDEAKESINTIPWNSIYGLRNRIVHGYDEINHTILWETINEDIPLLITELKTVLEKEKQVKKKDIR